MRAARLVGYATVRCSIGTTEVDIEGEQLMEHLEAQDRDIIDVDSDADDNDREPVLV
jgi:hypothetical protein